MMIKEVKKHGHYYISLVLIMLLSVLLIMQTQYGRGFQLLAAVLTAAFYIGWGVLHHFVHHNITAKIMIEYVLIASLGITIVLFIIKGA